MENAMGVVAVCAVALAVACLTAVLVRKSIWTLICLAGIFAGFSLGAITFAIAMKASGSNAIESNVFFIWSSIFALIGGILASKPASQLKLGKYSVTHGTALFGSYVFMHGWALLFGGLPDEVEIFPRLQQQDRIKLEGDFSVYLTILFGLFVLSSFIQRWSSYHEETKQTLDGKDPGLVEMADESNDA